MTQRRRAPRLLCVLAHPDDESLGTGGILARYGAEGAETFLLTATRGERGWRGDPGSHPGPEALGRIREAELRQAADVLGIREVALLGYRDGDLAQADADEVVTAITGHIQRVRPDVVVTFDPYGLYGHPDHVAISRHVTAAVVGAARPDGGGTGACRPHGVAKLYHMVWTEDCRAAYEEALGPLVMDVEGVARRPVTWPDWAITTRVDTARYWERVWAAIACHRSQLPGYETLRRLPEARQRHLWGLQTYHRVFSLVAAAPPEDDLLAGLGS